MTESIQLQEFSNPLKNGSSFIPPNRLGGPDIERGRGSECDRDNHAHRLQTQRRLQGDGLPPGRSSQVAPGVALTNLASNSTPPLALPACLSREGVLDARLRNRCWDWLKDWEHHD